MAKRQATGQRTAKPAATTRPGARGAKAREGAPQGRPADRSIRSTRGAPVARERETEIVRVRMLEGKMSYYDNKRRRSGDVFDLLRADHFNPDLHEKVHSRTRLRTTTSRQVLNEAHDDVLAKKYAQSRGQAQTDDAPDDLEDTGGNPLDD